MQLLIFQFLGGLGLFIFGMKTMSDGLQKLAGKRLRRILEMLSYNRMVAAFVGVTITAIIQSSSATSVMVIGFVNAGLMSLFQAVGIILGANIGTTVTAQLIAFKVSDYALPALALGVALKFFSKTPRPRQTGEILLGFGMLFYGLVTMKNGIGPLRHNEEFAAFFTMFDASSTVGIVLCIVAGMVLTVIVQSSSATVGISIALASQGLMDFGSSAAFILGDNIGTTVTAQLATIGTNRNARRVAWAHTMFNVLGVLVLIPVFPYFLKLVESFTSTFFGLGPPDTLVDGARPNIARYIANAHTLFNIVNCLVFLSILPVLVRTVYWIVPQKGKEDGKHTVTLLDHKYVNIPEIALKQVREEIHRMGVLAESTYIDVTGCMLDRDLKKLSRWKGCEETINRFQREIMDFLVKVSQGSISVEQGREISSLMRMTNNLERIGDSVENIAQLVEEMIENELDLAKDGMRDYTTVKDLVEETIHYTIESILNVPVDLMRKANKYEDSINFMREEMRSNYLMRLRAGVCAIDPGLVFTDMLAHFEKIGDYAFNVSQAIAGEK